MASDISSSSLVHASKTLKNQARVSVVFLLAEDCVSGLHVIQEINAAENEDEALGLFEQFILQCCAENPSRTTNMFVEAMCLIQNYRANRLLGLSKVEMSSPPFIDNINPVKKHLYRIADSLTEKQTVNFINRVNGDSLSTKCNLEEAILDWQVQGLVCVGTDLDSSSLEPITKHLQADQDVSCEISAQSEEDVYPIIDSSNLGFCIIVNNSEFTRNKDYPKLMPDHDLSQRPGSERDVQTVKEVFTWLKFQVRVHENVKFEKLRELLVSYANAVNSSHSCIVLVVMSHGTEDVVYTADSVPVSVEALEMAFQRNKCPLLTGKPKILIIQACQGANLQVVMKDSPTPSTLENLSLGPERGDALIAWSTVKGYASLRDRFEGSWFIQELCSELRSSAATRDLVDMVTRVNSRLRNKTYHGVFMVPSLSMSLCKKIKLL